MLSEQRTPPTGCETDFTKQKFATGNATPASFSSSIQDLKSLPSFHTNSLPRKMGQYPGAGVYGRFYDINTTGGHFQRSIPMRNSIAGSTSNYFSANHHASGAGHFGEFGPSDIGRDHTTFVEYFIPRSMSDFNLSLIKPDAIPASEGQILQPVLKTKTGPKSGEGGNMKMRVTFQDDMGLSDNLPPPPPTADEFM